MIYENFVAHGPTAEIRFETAEEIYANKTEVRCRSVKVGIVKQVKLADDLNSVVVKIEVDTDSADLLRDESRFWVVKPRLSAAEVSGLGTLIQGAYIELDPGPANAKRKSSFVGLETPPATNGNVPGLRLTLTAKEAGSLKIGAPIYYRGFEVGRIDGRKLADNGASLTYNAFIEDEYSHLVTKDCRFWNTSGIQLSADTDGVTLHTPSLQAMVAGGVSFGPANGSSSAGKCSDGDEFHLFPDIDAAKRATLNPTLKFLLLFDQSVRGLTTESAVEFRGIPIGRIAKISFNLNDQPNDPRIPVLIEVDPTLIHPETAKRMTAPDDDFFKEEIAKGLRAALKTTSLITGSVHIDLDYYPDSEPATLGKVGEYTTLPTIGSGFAQLEAKLTQLVDKLDSMPMSETMVALTDAAKETKSVAEATRKAFDNQDVKNLPKDLRETLNELQKTLTSIGPESEFHGELLDTLKSVKAVAELLEEKPNALIFGGKPKNKDDEDNDTRIKTGGPHRN